MTIKKIQVGTTTHDIRADSADKLNTNAGSATNPVYFANGIPVKTTYTLGKSVPSNAVFTDTVYTHPSYTARTGKPTANQTPAFGGTATVSQITSDGTGHVTAATDRTITIPSTLSNGTGTAGLIKTTSTVTSNSGYTACPVISGVPYYKDTDTNTDTKVTSSANNGTKIYFTGTSNSAGETNTQLLNTGIFADCETGYLHLTNLLHVGGDANWSKFFHNGTDTIISNGSGTGVLKLTSGGVLSLSTNSGSSFTNVSLEGHTHNYAAASHTHNYAGSSSAGGAATSANKVNTKLAIKLNGGATEGANLFTFNGSAAKTVNITPSAIGAAEDNHTHEVLLNYGSYGTQMVELNATGGTNGKGFAYIDASSTEGTRSYLMLNAEGVARLNGLEITSTSSPVTPNASSYRSYDTYGVQKSLIWLSTSNNLIVGNADPDATLAHSGHTYICAPNGNVRIHNSGQELIYNMSDNMGFFRPVTTNKNCLGGSSYRWQTIYAKNAVNTSSDYYQKENIQEMPQKYIDMLDDIEPVIFKFKDGDRLHGGYISQWVEESMEKYGITAEEFGGFCKDPKLDENEEVIEGEYEYSLRYSEFVPIIHAKMKQLNKEYKEEINKLKEEINELKLLINQ